MASWTSRSWYGFVLVSVLLLIALVQVLPQVDLPDTVLKSDRATVTMQASGASGPAQSAPAADLPWSIQAIALERSSPAPATAQTKANFLPILYKAIRC